MFRFYWSFLVGHFLQLITVNAKPSGTCCGKKGDVACRDLPEPCDCSQFCDSVFGIPTIHGVAAPRVLIIGDSIASPDIGYAMNVIALLGNGSTIDGGGAIGNAAVAIPRSYPQGEGYCGTSFGVLGCADTWLGTSEGTLWDVIHFNWGLHDIDNRYSDLVPHNGSNVYLENMEAIYQKMMGSLAPGGTLIWRTTTPVPPSYQQRNNSDVVTVNALAATLFGPCSKHPDVKVHDLYSQVLERCSRDPQSKGYPDSSDCLVLQNNGVHFSDVGRQFSGIMTAASILPYLQSRMTAAIV